MHRRTMLAFFHRITARVWATLHKRDLDEQLQDELDAHIALRTADLVRVGMTQEEAARLVNLELGGVTQLREAHRDARGLPFLDALAQDLRYSLRTLAKAPGFTAVAVATLALGIGVTTVVFTAYSAIKYRPIPAQGPEELVRLQWRAQDRVSDQFSWSEYERFAEGAHLFTSAFASSTPQTTVCSIFDHSKRAQQVVRIRFVSANYFGALGIKPEAGRLFSDGDADGVVVSDWFWRARLNGSAEISGKLLDFSGGSLPIVGVAAKSCTGTGVPPQTPDVWIPASAQKIAVPGADWIHDDGVREWQILAREKQSVSAQGQQELAMLSARWPTTTNSSVSLSASRATFFQTNTGAFKSFTQVCIVLMAAMILVLLIACVNLTHLIAARYWEREQEMALRLAIGAGRWRLIRQLCLENTLLAVAGGAVALLWSYWSCQWLALKAVELMRQVSNGALDIPVDVSPGWRVFCWTLAVSLLTAAVVGIAPAIRASRRDVNATLKQGAAGGITGGGRNLLLSVQVASCLILLAGAGLLLRGVLPSRDVNAGFEFEHLAVVGIDTQGSAQSATARLALLRQAVRRIESQPAVASVAWADRVPFLGTGTGEFRNELGGTMSCVFNGVSNRYFDTLGIRVLAGRTFRPEENEQEPDVAVISEATANRLWPGQNAVGRRIRPASGWMRDAVGHDSFTVIGVVKSVRSIYLSKADGGYVYLPRRLHDGGALLVVRTRIVPDRAFPSLSAALAAISPDLAARTFFSSMEEGPVRMQELMAQAPAIAAAVLGALALLLACIGIHGVVSHFVARRSREFGIRMALGARASNVIANVCSDSLRPVLWGAAAGLLGAFAISGFLHALIVMPDMPDLTYGAGAFDPVSFLGVLLVLAIVVLAAACGPVWRATRVDAAVALRDE